MSEVDKYKIAEWGSDFSDRKNTFDDTKDINLFKKSVKPSKEFARYLAKYVKPGPDIKWKTHPDGPYGIDLVLMKDGKKIAGFDLERWSQWEDDWPVNYQYCSFLRRKDKYLDWNIPFFMVWTNKFQDKFLLCEKETIKKYPPEPKEFSRHNNVVDMVRKIPFDQSVLFSFPFKFGPLERKNFPCVLLTNENKYTNI